MKCPSCGRENPEEVNFCFYCGHSFREFGDAVKIVSNAGSDDEIENSSEMLRYYKENKSETSEGHGENVSVSSMRAWQWALYFMLLVLPYAWVAWIVVTIVWAMSENGSAERKSFAKGMLAFLTIVLVISIIASMYLIATMGINGAINYLTGGVATSADALMQQSGMQ